MDKYRVEVNGKAYEVLLHSRDGSSIKFEIDGQLYDVGVTPCLKTVPEKTDYVPPTIIQSKPTGQKSISHDRVVAPMPGIVVTVAVQAGTKVEHGSLLCVIEAMKMENNITSNRSGTVKEVLISPGQELDNGQTLIVFE